MCNLCFYLSKALKDKVSVQPILHVTFSRNSRSEMRSGRILLY